MNSESGDLTPGFISDNDDCICDEKILPVTARRLKEMGKRQR
jgi:hypothetical protein